MKDESLRDKIRLKTKNDYGIDLTEEDISLCEYEMETRKVSIFHGQIYPNKRSRKVWDPKSKETRKIFFIRWELTIDGARAIAHRHGLCGIDKPIFEDGPDGPVSAEVTVYKRGPRGERYPFVGLVRYDEFVQTYWDENKKQHVPNTMWKNSPYNQLAKCAESQALRKGFQELCEDDPFLVADTDPHPAEHGPLDELTRVTEEMGLYEKEGSISKSSPVFEVGGIFQDRKIIDKTTEQNCQKLVLEGGIKVTVFDNGLIDFENALDVPLDPKPSLESQKIENLEQARDIAVPLLKRWCEEKNNGKKVSYKEAYKELLGVVVTGDMTLNDYENLIEQLQEELGK